MILTSAVVALVALVLLALVVELTIVRDLSRRRAPPPGELAPSPPQPQPQAGVPLLPVKAQVVPEPVRVWPEDERFERLRGISAPRLQKVFQPQPLTPGLGAVAEVLVAGEVRIEVWPEATEGRFRARTVGLGRFGRPELDVAGLGGTQAELSGGVMLLYLAAWELLREFIWEGYPEKPPGPGEDFVIELEHLHVECRCAEWVVDGRRVLRLVDREGEELKSPMISSVLYDQAMEFVDAEPPRFELALPLLLGAVQCFPGDPAKRVATFTEGRVYNISNYLSYLALARVDPERATRWYRMALERCAALEAFELGTQAPPEVEKSRLMADVALIASTNLAAGPPELAWDHRTGRKVPEGGPFGLPSPLWDVGYKGRVWRAVSVLPKECARYVFGPGTQDRLVGEPELQALIADVYHRMRQHPLEALVDTWKVRNFYVGWPNAGNVQKDERLNIGGPARRSVVGRYQPHYKLLSTVMAQVCWYLAAGATQEELRAAYGLEANQVARERAEQKLGALKAEEARWFQALEKPPREDPEAAA